MATKKKPPRVLVEALARSQRGDVEGALALLEPLGDDAEPDAQGLRFLLLMRLQRAEDALAVADATVPRVAEPLLRSTWLLRRGMLMLELDRPLEALQDLHEVLQLDASPDHGDQARKALLRVAESGRIQ